MLEDQIRKVLIQASKDRNTLSKNILSLALGEIQTVEARGKTLSEKDKEDIILKLVKSNTQTLEQLVDGDQRKVDLGLENEVLKQFLPKTLSKIQTMILVSAIYYQEGENNCTTVGKTIGFVMKHAKINNVAVDNKLVKECVEELLKTPPSSSYVVYPFPTPNH